MTTWSEWYQSANSASRCSLEYLRLSGQVGTCSSRNENGSVSSVSMTVHVRPVAASTPMPAPS